MSALRREERLARKDLVDGCAELRGRFVDYPPLPLFPLLCSPPPRDELVAATGLSAYQIEEALSVARATVSLNQLFGSDGQQTELVDLIPDPSTFEPPENELERIRRRRLIRHALGELPDRERLVVDHHYGLTGEPQTLNEIGHELGLTRERVRQLEAHALATLSHSPELLEQR